LTKQMWIENLTERKDEENYFKKDELD